jgi:hypothetical protein
MTLATLTPEEVKALQGSLLVEPTKVAKIGLSKPVPKPPPPTEVTVMDPLIAAILCTKRAHNSTGELNFVKWLHEHLEKLGHKPVAMAEGAVTVQIGSGFKTLFSCHVDTMHSTHESDGSLQSVFFDEAFQHIFLADKKSGCLGADDGAGIYIMLKMIEAKVGGTYIFHRGEERGGISANAMKAKHPEWLKQFSACIAFDRPNSDEVIITQGGTPCASVGYGKALAKALTDLGLKYEISTKGVFTDSKVYNSIIPECINIGVGYAMQHSSSEYQDWNHLNLLTQAAIKLDWAALKPERVPVAEVAYKQSESWKGMRDYSFGKGQETKNTGTTSGKPSLFIEPEEPTLDFDFETMSREDIDDYCGGDADMTNGIVRLLCDLDAERAKVTRLQYLLGM